MNPLFISHLVADFLLQPTWLVRLKEKSLYGVILHGLIHAAVMAILIMPTRLNWSLYILAIAALHGIIDYAKIIYTKKHNGFALPFLADQFAHFTVLVMAAFLIPAMTFWHTAGGKIILLLLAFYSFGIALWNLKTQRASETAGRVFLLVLVFALYAAATPLLAAAACSAP